MKKAFTLVELLIVITLISILSVAVLATINPIEQTNKARDAQFKNDAAELVSAYERFFASQNKYPWNVAAGGVGETVVEGTDIGVSSPDVLFSVVGSAVGTTDSPLFSTSELKSSFMGKAPFLATVSPQDTMWLYTNGSDLNYVCYVPKAKVNRTGANATKLKCLLPGRAAGDTPTLEDVGPVGDPNCEPIVADADWVTYVVPDGAHANLMCVPE
ncbi:MAG: type II secretion system protein [Candidatus Shapirobacteria bacterium]